MKTTIYELLGMIKNNNAPKKILFDNQIWNYRARTDMEGTILFEEYINEETDEDLFDEYLILDILSNEVEILETTITYNQDNIENNKQDKKIKKLEIGFNTKLPNGAETENIAFLMVCINWLAYKTNEIIDRWNNQL